MADCVELKFKSQSGDVHTLQIAELLEVDGLPFTGGEIQQQLDRIEMQLSRLCVVVADNESE